MIFYELSRGLAYIRIRHPYLKIYTILLPFVCSVVLLSCFILLPVPPALLGKDGVLASTLSVTSTLPGFYFAGLAAVATFGSADMDKRMPDPAPSLTVRLPIGSSELLLSRRQFLSYLFAYLVLVSFALCGIILAANAAASSLHSLKTHIINIPHVGTVWEIGKLLFVAALSWLVSSLTITTLHGMFFLSEKIHQP